MSDTNNAESRKTIRISLPVSAYAILAYRAAMAGVTVTDYVATMTRISAIPKKGEPGYQAEFDETVG